MEFTTPSEEDRRLALESNNSDKVRDLLADSRPRELMLDQPRINLESFVWQGQGKLVFTEARPIDDPERLAKLKELFGRTLDRLVEIGCAEAP